jgi:hypothetical protein
LYRSAVRFAVCGLPFAVCRLPFAACRLPYGETWVPRSTFYGAAGSIGISRVSAFTPVPGLWFDLRRPDGTFIDSPAPASTFYHLVGAIVALDTPLRSSQN